MIWLRHTWISAAFVVAMLLVSWWMPSAARAAPVTTTPPTGGVLNNAFGIPRAEDGNGVKLGERTTFHAGFALGTGVDSNVYYQRKVERPVTAGFVWPSAWIGIGNRALRDGMLMTPAERSGRILDYNISVLGGFRQYLAKLDTVRQAPRFSIGTQLRLALLPGRKFSTHLDADFFRGAFPSNYVTTRKDLNFNRDDFRSQLAFIFRPGGGRLSLALGARFQLLQFEHSALYRNNRKVFGLMHETKWRFLPRSSLVLSYTMDYSRYDCCQDIGIGRNEDNYAHRLLVGYRGEAFKKFTFELMVGWGGGFYRQDPNGPDFNSFIGNAAMNYFPTLRSVIHVSVFRNFQDSLFGNYYVDNGARLSLGHQFRWRMIGHLGFAIAARRYHGLPAPGGGGEDDRISGYRGNGAAQLEIRGSLLTLDAKIEQPLGKVFSIALGYNLFLDTSNFEIDYANGGVDHLGYVKHLAMLLLSVRI